MGSVDYETGALDKEELEDEMEEPMRIAWTVIAICVIVCFICVLLNFKQGTFDVMSIKLPSLDSLFSLPSMSY